jgi:hypothetical protein
VFLNSPCYETPNNAIKKIDKNKIKRKEVTDCFRGLRQMYVTFISFFSRAPCRPPLPLALLSPRSSLDRPTHQRHRFFSFFKVDFGAFFPTRGAPKHHRHIFTKIPCRKLFIKKSTKTQCACFPRLFKSYFFGVSWGGVQKHHTTQKNRDPKNLGKKQPTDFFCGLWAMRVGRGHGT